MLSKINYSPVQVKRNNTGLKQKPQNVAFGTKLSPGFERMFRKTSPNRLTVATLEVIKELLNDGKDGVLSFTHKRLKIEKTKAFGKACFGALELKLPGLKPQKNGFSFVHPGAVESCFVGTVEKLGGFKAIDEKAGETGLVFKAIETKRKLYDEIIEKLNQMRKPKNL